ncbi:MAG: alpha/beta hydrolase [Rhodospirillales bacterium]|nr:alpha/beta hydrolase [Rhodospirillales bacterium]
MKAARFFGSMALLLAVGAAPAAAEFFPGPPGVAVDLPTRPGVTQRYALFAPDEPPRATVVLFVGGQGAVNVPDRTGPTWQQRGNFLSRSRELFRRRGLMVAVVDAPSDRRDGLGDFRASAEHAEDMAAVIADLRRRTSGAPVWLVGTSRGTISAANVAARLQGAKAANGLVLTSSVTRPPSARRAPSYQTVYDTDLAAIGIPTLVVYHRTDGCYVTPSADAPALVAKMTKAPKTELLGFEGGDPPLSDPCEALAAHGFLGIEERVVNAIVDWILTFRA